MKSLLLNILVKYLSFRARIFIWRSKPFIIGINWSVWKTSCRMIVYQTMKQLSKKKIYTSPKNFNWEVWMPLSILQIEKFDTLIWKILTLLMVPYLAFFGAKKKDIMILEYGIDYPWEMDKLLSIVKPDIGIMTQLDSVHSLQFWDPTAIAKEEIKMVKNTKDVVFLNYDDDYAKQLIWKLKSDQITYWINSQEWQIKIANLDYQFNPELSWGKVFTQWIISVNKKNLVISTNLIGRENFIYVWLALNIFDIINYGVWTITKSTRSSYICLRK
jgi:UDP-N-acetylmuramyl pentapeptide synthase